MIQWQPRSAHNIPYKLKPAGGAVLAEAVLTNKIKHLMFLEFTIVLTIILRNLQLQSGLRKDGNILCVFVSKML